MRNDPCPIHGYRHHPRQCRGAGIIRCQICGLRQSDHDDWCLPVGEVSDIPHGNGFLDLKRLGGRQL